MYIVTVESQEKSCFSSNSKTFIVHIFSFRKSGLSFENKQISTCVPVVIIVLELFSQLSVLDALTFTRCIGAIKHKTST